MTSPRFIRTIAVIAMSAFVLGAFVSGPAEAKKKKKKPAVCKAYTPGELGTDKPTLVVTDAATEEAPAVQKVTVAESAGDLDQVGVGEGPFAPGIDAFNIQVDSKAKEAGLHILVEFPERNDVDLNVSYPDGSYAARAHGFQPILGTPAEADFGNTTGHAGESTTTTEHIVGIRTADCGGWTVDVQNWLGMGGELDVKVWLGDVANDPQAAGAETP